MLSEILKVNIQSNVDLFSLEGESELLVEALEDFGVFDCLPNQTIECGTYTNRFSVVHFDKKKVKDGHRTEKVILCCFYDIMDPVYIRLITFTDVHDELIDREACWYSNTGEHIPSEHPNFIEIKENLDLF